jgi:hypothetical protein
VLKVALRHELFSQLRFDKRLVSMGPKVFARRATKYKIGRSSETDRPCGVNAIILNHEFVVELVTDFGDEQEVRDLGAHA